MRKSRKLLATFLGAAMVMASLGACTTQKSAETTTTAAAGETTKAAEGETTKAAEGGETTKAASGEKMHIDVIAKGFQHQFWKAVELGSKKAAEEFGIDVTFQ